MYLLIYSMHQGDKQADLFRSVKFSVSRNYENAIYFSEMRIWTLPACGSTYGLLANLPLLPIVNWEVSYEYHVMMFENRVLGKPSGCFVDGIFQRSNRLKLNTNKRYITGYCSLPMTWLLVALQIIFLLPLNHTLKIKHISSKNYWAILKILSNL